MISASRLPRKLKDRVRALTIPRVPRAITQRFTPLGNESIARLREVLRREYFDSDDAYLGSPEGQEDFEDHLHRRLDQFRTTVIPWLQGVRPLEGTRILEIGCGTGSSSVALAEQGASVTGIDIARKSLEAARSRCAIYGVSASFLEMNAVQAPELLSSSRYDLVIFFAALEHMTQDERMKAMHGSWGAMRGGDLWCLIDTPNRLWFFDSHTSMLPFFFWLPDELAIKYGQFSPIKSLQGHEASGGQESMLKFLRKGRGVSFHEFDLWMERAANLEVLSSLPLFLRQRSIVRRLLWSLTDEARYESLLARVGPPIHRGFFQPSLDLIIRKPS